jgi:hypothetical protein
MRGMYGQQLFKLVKDGRIERSFQITVRLSAVTTDLPFLVHRDIRFLARSTERVEDRHGQSARIQKGDDDFRIDSHIPATRPGQESEPTIGRTKLLRWGAYILGILLFVGGISIVLF